MSVVADHGIILRVRPYRDTSVIVHWLAAESGRIATSARAARGPKSPFLGKLDLCVEADFSLRRSPRGDVHTLGEVVPTDFHAGVRNPLASGNTDLAPTILWLLGFRAEAMRMDGRVLGEALVAADAPALRSVSARRLRADRELPGIGRWSQYLQIVEINGVRYLDEGNGAFVPSAGASGAEHKKLTE